MRQLTQNCETDFSGGAKLHFWCDNGPAVRKCETALLIVTRFWKTGNIAQIFVLSYKRL